jgi:cell division cycle 14
VLYQEMTPDEAYRPFLHSSPPLPSFRDATDGPSSFGLSVLDVAKGIYKAKQSGFINFGKSLGVALPISRGVPGAFDLHEYERCECPENGDLNWIVPGKFLAFAGPMTAVVRGSTDSCTHPPGLLLCVISFYCIFLWVSVSTRSY